MYTQRMVIEREITNVYISIYHFYSSKCAWYGINLMIIRNKGEHYPIGYS